MILVKIQDVKPNPKNPRVIKDDKFKKLVKSIQDFPDMLNKRPLIVFSDVDGKYTVLGGNMRLKALNELKFKEVPVIIADEWTEEQKAEFLIKDNVGFGEWEWETLRSEWNLNDLENWGLEVPKISETERLSDLIFEDIYYEPEFKPNLKLSECIDLNKFHKKIEAINNSNLSNEQKDILMLFAYRFIKIDFESVANYYFFNASEQEKKIIEQLRLVLCDAGLNGFIQDDLIKIHNYIEDWEND